MLLTVVGRAFAMGCAPYERYDPETLANVTMRFGVPYTVHSEPAPYLSAGNVRFGASFASGCPVFELAHEAARAGTVLVAARQPCAGSEASQHDWSGSVSVPLPAGLSGSANDLLLAFPPGSQYELYRIAADPLAPAAVDTPHQPADPAGKGDSRLAADEGDSSLVGGVMRLYVHRSEPKRANLNGPCSTLIELSTGDAAYERACGLSAARLGIRIAALLDEASGQEALALTDGLHLVALEEAPPPPPRAPLPRAMPPPPPITCCPAEGCDYGGGRRLQQPEEAKEAPAEAELLLTARRVQAAGATNSNESDCRVSGGSEGA